ncbi:MAG: biotin-dependent carboxyltransferase family protein [Halopseudomonas sp.]|uniref:5-oxoprolinase subunit C family protein n=1 Tax=Halopseudomonas sp. TaxID=2901191 RepID=UPI0030019AD7
MSRLRVEQTLGFAQLQDGGRFGVRHLGVTQGGALDWIAQHWANWLLGNPLDACVLEIPLGGLTLTAEADGWLALTGADLAATLDQQPLAPWQAFTIRRGQVLRFNTPQSGVRGYLAAAGGFQAPAVLGAVATVMREGLGGLQGDGSALKVADQLSYDSRSVSPRQMPVAAIPDYTAEVRLQLLLGAQGNQFSGASLFALFNQPWTLDQRADRMGMRLTGPALRYQGAPLISEGIPLGAVQVPPDGQPIVLLNDRQTIGGYPRLGALTPASLARLAQCAPGQRLRLQPISQQQARQEHLALLANWES